jgi:hypothetical protein
LEKLEGLEVVRLEIVGRVGGCWGVGDCKRVFTRWNIDGLIIMTMLIVAYDDKSVLLYFIP